MSEETKVKKEKRLKHHYTSHEKKFIDGLGSFSESTGFNRKKLWLNYIQASSKRVNWGAINKEEAVDHAMKRYTEFHG